MHTHTGNNCKIRISFLAEYLSVMVMMGMKMAAVSSVSLLLLLTSIVTTTDSQDCNYHAAKKQDVTLPLTHVLKESDQLRWLHESIVIFDRRGKAMVTGNPDDVDQNGSLRLRNVDQSKAGTYTPTVYDDGQRIGNLKPMVLCVMDPVSQPQVTSECVIKPLLHSPVCRAKGEPKLKERSFKGVLKDVEQRVYRCRVYNKVSSLTSAPFRQNCTQSVLDNGFIFPADIFGINIWIIIGGGGGVVLLLIITVIICCVTNKRKKRMKIKDEEELRLGWSNSNPQCQHQNHPPDHQKQQPHQHTHRQQKPAGHSTGPRQHRCKQPPGQQRNQVPQVPSHQPEPGTRRAEQGRRQPAGNDSERPPLPQPRRKIQK
ncbi:T-cell surface antigen CD2-like [Takifugu flavidus]|uniref:T-cell surface antigen CD2-like n=1 Tax=Takifugu flavidus TaxID=433684 RepID=UPI002544385D|nr:T-cell surface antigen CD2-like [Takifugu flavidus]